jgi:hypothetical protein
MQFVTISDHNCIDGALEIGHLPDTFISNEITAYFPDDGCKVHVLCWNINERQFDDIQRLRENIVELRDYLDGEGIVHACAHPLYSVNDRLSLDHFERLLLLFNVFETMNGGRNARGNDLVLSILRALTREQLEEIANRHPITPIGARPWVKGCTGGSDDHSAVFIAKGFTECPHSTTVAEYLQHVQNRHSIAGGLDGTPLSFAHSLYGIGYQYYRDRFVSKSGSGSRMLLKVMGDVFGRAQDPQPLRARVSGLARKITLRAEADPDVQFRRTVESEVKRLFAEAWLRDDFIVSAARYEELNRETFALASEVSNQLLFRFFRKFVEKLSSGSLFGCLEALSAASPIVFGVTPYLFSFGHQNRDRAFLADVSERFLGRGSRLDARPKKAWFTDMVTDEAGAVSVIRELCRLAEAHEHDLTLVSAGDTRQDYPGRVQWFEPVGQLPVPGHENVTVAFPPFLRILEFCDREGFTELVVSSPGVTGLAALAAGKLLQTRLTGIFHTDLPKYIRDWTDDESMESAAWRYVRWFYDQMDTILVPDPIARRQLMAKGFDPAKLRVLGVSADGQLSDRTQWENAYAQFWNTADELPARTADESTRQVSKVADGIV